MSAKQWFDIVTGKCDADFKIYNQDYSQKVRLAMFMQELNKNYEAQRLVLNLVVDDYDCSYEETYSVGWDILKHLSESHEQGG